MLGANLVDFPGNVSTLTIDLTTFKALLNGTISDPGTHFMTTDIIKFYMNTQFDSYEYMRLALDLMPK